MDEEMNKEKFIEMATKADEEKRQWLVMFQDTDGNWRGALTHLRGNENPVFSRAIGPETVLQELLTHDGK